MEKEAERNYRNSLRVKQIAQVSARQPLNSVFKYWSTEAVANDQRFVVIAQARAAEKVSADAAGNFKKASVAPSQGPKPVRQLPRQVGRTGESRRDRLFQSAVRALQIEDIRLSQRRYTEPAALPRRRPFRPPPRRRRRKRRRCSLPFAPRSRAAMPTGVCWWAGGEAGAVGDRAAAAHAAVGDLQAGHGRPEQGQARARPRRGAHGGAGVGGGAAVRAADGAVPAARAGGDQDVEPAHGRLPPQQRHRPRRARQAPGAPPLPPPLARCVSAPRRTAAVLPPLLTVCTVMRGE